MSTATTFFAETTFFAARRRPRMDSRTMARGCDHRASVRLGDVVQTNAETNAQTQTNADKRRSNADTRFSFTAFDDGELVSSFAWRGEFEVGSPKKRRWGRLDRRLRAGHLSVGRQRSHSHTLKSRLSRMRRHNGRGRNTTGDQRWRRDPSAAGPFPRHGRTNGQIA